MPTIATQEQALVQDIMFAVGLSTYETLRIQGLFQGGPRGSDIQELLSRGLVDATGELPSVTTLLDNLKKLNIEVSLTSDGTEMRLLAEPDLQQAGQLPVGGVKTICVKTSIGRICYQIKYSATQHAS